MSFTLLGDPTAKLSTIRGDEFSYRYPKGLKLNPGKTLHNELLVKIIHRAAQGYHEIQKRHADWRAIDSVLKAYITPEDLKKEKTDGSYDKIIVPISYITLETILTYMMSAFMQDPVWQYSGTGPEDKIKALLHTAVVDVHTKRYGLGMKIYTALRDMFAYGIGASHATWKRDLVRGTTIDEEGNRVAGELQVRTEGNDLVTIDPYRYIPDPNVPAHTPQEGEFQAWVTRTTYPRLRNMEIQNPDHFFNVQYLREIDGRSFVFNDQDHLEEGPHFDDQRPVDILWFYIDLIPADWKLGKEEDPEKWLFAVAGDALIISARPAGLHHGMFPVAVGAPDTDGYTSTPVSRLGLIHDLQEHSNFMFSSHIENIKRSVNNEIIYDPFMINEHDMLDSKPGKRIRLRQAAWGRGDIQKYVHQLQIQDVTSQNMDDVAFMRQMADDLTGARNALRGQVVNRGPRISSTEAQGARLSNLSKMEKDAVVIGLQYMQPLGRMFAAHNQQFLDQELMVSTTGELEKALRETFPGRQSQGQITVGPEQLLGGPFDVLVHDGTIPGREDANAWITFLQVAGQIPGALASLDMPRLIRHIARQLGAKSVDQFINTSIQVQPDEVVQQQIAAGNLVGGNGAI